MKRIVTLLIMLTLSLSTLQAAAFEKNVKFRTTKVHISALKPLTAGSNTFVFNIKKDGKTPTGAKVSIKAFMPAMPGMPAMESKVEATSLGKGKYQATVNMAMSGTWQLHIFITPKSGKKSRVKTSLTF